MVVFPVMLPPIILSSSSSCSINYKIREPDASSAAPFPPHRRAFWCHCPSVPQLRGFLTEVLIDQLPILLDLQRFLAHLAMTDPAPPKTGLTLEQVHPHSAHLQVHRRASTVCSSLTLVQIPEIRNHIMRQNSGKWKGIAKYQAKETFNLSEKDLQIQAHR